MRSSCLRLTNRIRVKQFWQLNRVIGKNKYIHKFTPVKLIFFRDTFREAICYALSSSASYLIVRAGIRKTNIHGFSLKKRSENLGIYQKYDNYC